MTPKEYRYCIGCKNFYMEIGEPDLSDVTAGSRGYIECAKGHFRFPSGLSHYQSIELLMLVARTCDDYDERELPPHNPYLPSGQHG